MRLLLAQVSFFVFLLIAVFMTTGGFKYNRGLSFYGEHWTSALPYGAGFMACDYFLLSAASLLPKAPPESKRLALLINLLAALLIAVLLTPNTVNSFFNWSHTIASSVLFLYELYFSIWFARLCFSDRLVWLLIGLQFLSGVLAMLSNFHVVFYLSEGTLVFQLVFSTLLVYGVAQFLNKPGLSSDGEKLE